MLVNLKKITQYSSMLQYDRRYAIRILYAEDTGSLSFGSNTH